MMETTFYEDTMSATSMDRIKQMKTAMSLDFNSQKSRQAVKNGVLASPDLNLLKLGSPELERMIIQQNGMVTTTPTPTQFLFPKSVTEEQEAYARGFVDALAELHETHGDPRLECEEDEDMVSDDVSMPPPNIPTMVVGSVSNMPPPSTNYHVMTSQAQQNGSTMTSAASNRQQNGSMMTSATGGNRQQQYTFSTTTALPGSIIPQQQQNLHIVSSSMEQAMPVSSSHGVMAQAQQPHTSGVSNLPQHIELFNNPSPFQPKMEDPQTVPCLGNTPPMSPINMDEQEGIKQERKRARNRVAARKCRERKLHRISRLEVRVDELKGQNTDLNQTATALREQVCKLKKQIMQHVNSGCQVMLSPNLAL